MTCWGNMYLLITSFFFFNLAPSRITNKEIQNECVNRPKSFLIIKILDYFIIPIAMAHNEDWETPSLLSAKGQALHRDVKHKGHILWGRVWTQWRSTMSQRCPQPHTGAGSDNRPEPKPMGVLLHTPLSSLRGEAAAGGRRLPPGNNLSRPKFHGTHPISSHGRAGRIFSMHS